MYPAMRRAGYPETFSAGLITAVGAIDIIIPPSIPMIVYGAAASELVPRLYAAGILPGLLIAAMQNRTIDGMTGGFSIFTTFKYFDVAKGLTQLPGSFLVATALVNRKWMQSLGPDLEAMVRDESRRAEALFSTFGVEDVRRIAATWKKNGGEIISFSPADHQGFLKEVTASAAAILNANPQFREDYQALQAAAKKNRR